MFTTDQYNSNYLYYKPNEEVLGPIQQIVMKENQTENKLYYVSVVCYFLINVFFSS